MTRGSYDSPVMGSVYILPVSQNLKFNLSMNLIIKKQLDFAILSVWYILEGSRDLR